MGLGVVRVLGMLRFEDVVAGAGGNDNDDNNDNDLEDNAVMTTITTMIEVISPTP